MVAAALLAALAVSASLPFDTAQAQSEVFSWSVELIFFT
jgi:hypothetical protein